MYLMYTSADFLRVNLQTPAPADILTISCKLKGKMMRALLTFHCCVECVSVQPFWLRETNP